MPVTGPKASRLVANSRLVQVVGFGGLLLLMAFLRHDHPAAERNHELVVAALDGANIRDDNVVVVCGAPRRLESYITLQIVVQSVAESDVVVETLFFLGKGGGCREHKHGCEE